MIRRFETSPGRAAALALAGLSLAMMTLTTASPAQACGGFFCNRAPVDQSAERILFVVKDGKTVMIPQIQYQGDPEDFAWVLPVPDVPEERDVFPQLGLDGLDSNSGLQFDYHPECQQFFPEASAGLADDSAPTEGSGAEPPAVNVELQEQVGPYDVVVVSSEDPAALADWLRDNDYRISDAMDPYIKLYTDKGMKFLALKLQSDKDSADIAPFKMVFDGENPSIPLVLTQIAAEPEMGILVWVFADQRFEPANATEVEIDAQLLRWNPDDWNWPVRTNWTSLVARAVDQVEGKGWAVEYAGRSDEIRDLLRRPIPNWQDNFEERQQALDALNSLLQDAPYYTRFYTRVSPFEMDYDPLFRRSQKEDVARYRELPYVEALCSFDQPYSEDPCDFVTCGAFGLCRTADLEDGSTVTGCACAPGTTARTTFAPDGQATVICQDKRLSFINPGMEMGGEVLPDPCATFDCGSEGTCIAMNMTPTCECPMGKVARGWFDSEGMRRGSCVTPKDAIPESFYNRRPPERIDDLPTPVEVDLPAPTGMSDTQLQDMGMDPFTGAPVSGRDPVAVGGTSTDAAAEGGSCTLSTPGNTSSTGGMLLALLAAACLRARRRRS